MLLSAGGAVTTRGAGSRTVRRPHGVCTIAGVRSERRRDDADPTARHRAVLAGP